MATRRSGSSSSRIVRVGLTQMACGPDPAANLEHQLRLAERAMKGGARIVCTQELFRSQYFCQVEDHRFFGLAETIPGPSPMRSARWRKARVGRGRLAVRKARGRAVPQHRRGHRRGRIHLGIYRKMHIPDDPLYYEKFYFTPGDTGFRAWRPHGTIGVLVCWDQWFPEGARLTALQGAEICSTPPPSAGTRLSEKAEYGEGAARRVGTHPAQPRRRQRLLRLRSQPHGPRHILDTRGKPVDKDGIEFWGQSFVAARRPDRQARAGRSREVLLVDCDLARVEFSRTHWPFLRDRRIDRRLRPPDELGYRFPAECAARAGRTQAAIVDWGYNAWGGKYPPFDADDVVPTRVAAELGIKTVFNPGIVMEGGAVDFNGEGTVLTTTSCLLNPNRNPGLSQADIERYLRDYYGQRHVVWLGEGIEGDDTDGHVDDLARFLDPRTIVIGMEENRRDANYAVLRANRRLLDEATDADGRPFDIVELPMPRPVRHGGQRLPATYMNFYFVNGALLVPTFGQPDRDRRALAILQAWLPTRRVVGVDCRTLIWGLGAIHCLTQQQPRF
jgi:agmatine/peptidylarginine deiminase/predicted amidohydrolase